jgi:hypothetical protein
MLVPVSLSSNNGRKIGRENFLDQTRWPTAVIPRFLGSRNHKDCGSSPAQAKN